MGIFTSGTGSEIDRKTLFKTPENETGWDRVKMMFNLQEDGPVGNTPEFQLITSTAMTAFISGGTMGAILTMSEGRAEYIRKNHDAVFSSDREAKRKLYDRMILTMMRSGWRLGWRLGIFCGSYTAIVTTIAVYRNKAGIREHLLAGFLVGGAWKFKLGLKGTLVGGIAGGALGIIAGSMVVGSLWMAGSSVEQLRYWNHNYWQSQLRMKAEELRAQRETSQELIMQNGQENE